MWDVDTRAHYLTALDRILKIWKMKDYQLSPESNTSQMVSQSSYLRLPVGVRVFRGICCISERGLS